MITLYSTSTCGKCNVLKIKLDNKKIQYEVNQSYEDMSKLGIRSVPILEMDGKLLNYIEANKWVEEQ